MRPCEFGQRRKTHLRQSGTPPIGPRDCIRYERCSAAICPLDADWSLRVLQKDDATCFYLTEAVKDGAEARFQAAGLEHLYLGVTEALPAIVAIHPRVRDALVRSARSGSRMDPVPRGAGS